MSIYSSKFLQLFQFLNNILPHIFVIMNFKLGYSFTSFPEIENKSIQTIIVENMKQAINIAAYL